MLCNSHVKIAIGLDNHNRPRTAYATRRNKCKLMSDGEIWAEPHVTGKNAKRL